MADLLTVSEVRAHLNLGADTSHDTMIAAWIDSVTAHVERRYTVLPSGAVTELARVISDDDGTWRLMPSLPVVSVTSITDGTTTYSTGFTVSAEGYIEHDDLAWSDRWTITYVAGVAALPADLRLAALEDIRALYQPAQIGPPADFGAFGIESTDVGPTFRPVRMWPRVDAWLAEVRLPGFA